MTETYALHPGAKGTNGTSQDAAETIKPCVSHLRRVAMQALEQLDEAPLLEAAAFTKFERDWLQPRFSECRAIAFIETTGERRRNPSAKLAAVLRLTAKGRRVLADG